MKTLAHQQTDTALSRQAEDDISTPLSLDEMEALPPGSIVEDRHKDQATRTKEGLWEFPETALLTAYYVHKHYSPIVLIARGEVSDVGTHRSAYLADGQREMPTR